MKFLKTHTGAMVVLAVVIVLSVLLGSHRSLVQAREKVRSLRPSPVISRTAWTSPPTCSPWRGGTWTRVSWVS